MTKRNKPTTPKVRHHERKRSQRQPYDRVLIVCEGAKTELNYLTEIRQENRLASANVQILSSSRGTAPLQVVEYAKDLLKNGNPHKKIKRKFFNKVFAVFDRDTHHSYMQALQEAENLDMSITNDSGKKVAFTAIPSNPCFELWILLHYECVNSHQSCADIEDKIKRHYPQYTKGSYDVYSKTKSSLDEASRRAKKLAQSNSPSNDGDLYTDVFVLVDFLKNLKQKT